MQVLMFHSVGNEQSHWYRNWLSCSIIHFENFCRYLISAGFRTIFLEEWYDLKMKKSSDDKSVALTFDDGYADNWVYLFPLLMKYNLKATIFINPDFVDPSEYKRSNLHEVLNGKCSLDDLKPLGFLNWLEIVEMVKSGIIDIQSHSMTHNFNFKSDKLLDIYTGQIHYDWLAWNLFPESKPGYITRKEPNGVPLGYPVFEFDRALKIRKYFPDEAFAKYCMDIYKDGYNVIRDQAKLASMLRKYPGRYETDQEMEERYWFELKSSKDLLENRLGKPVQFLCWPGGGYNDVSVALSIKAGYKASTISTKDIEQNENQVYKRIRRFGMSSVIMAQKQKFFISNPNHLIHIFKSRTGNLFYRNLLRSKKLYYLIKARIKSQC